MFGSPQSYAPGEVGQAFEFDGSGDNVINVGNSGLEIQDFTIECWTRQGTNFNSIDSFAAFFSLGDGGYQFGITKSGALYLAITMEDEYIDAPYNVQSSPQITDTNFHHVAVTKSGSNVWFFVDGTSALAPPFVGSFQYPTDSPSAIGQSPDDEENFEGLIDELSVYNRALTAGEIQAIYNAGTAGKCVEGPAGCTPAPSGLVSWWRGEGDLLDQIGGNNGAVVGSPLTYDEGEVGEAFNFSGDTEVDVGSADNLRLQDFTIEGWLSAPAIGLRSGTGIIFGFGEDGYQFGIYQSGALYLAINQEDDYDGPQNEVESANGITDTNFHHFAVTKSGTMYISYIDGVGELAPPLQEPSTSLPTRGLERQATGITPSKLKLMN